MVEWGKSHARFGEFIGHWSDVREAVGSMSLESGERPGQGIPMCVSSVCRWFI